MTATLDSYLDIIRQTPRYRPDVEKAAECAPGKGPDFYNALIQKLVDNGEEKTLGIALTICAFNNIVLDPDILGQAFRVVENKLDAIRCCGVQTANFLPVIYKIAEDKLVSTIDRVLAANVATELAVKFKTKRHQIEKILLKLDRAYLDDFFKEFLDRCWFLLDEDGPDISLWTEQHPLVNIPEEKEPVTLSSGYTVQRPVPKISRNAPCHCGSGKKYKKCCYDKDQELLRDPSPYKGLTMTEVKKSPGLAKDAKLIKEMAPLALKKLVPSELNADQLFEAYRSCQLHGLITHSYDLLMELRSRPGKKAFAENHLEDVFDAALDHFDVSLADKISEIIPKEQLFHSKLTELQYKIVKKHKHLLALEKFCRIGITQKDIPRYEHPFLALAYLFRENYPGLSIAFARVALLSEPDRYLDNDLLVDDIINCRIDLDVDPWDDPAIAYYRMFLHDAEEMDELEQKDEQIEELAGQLKEARKTISSKTQQLRQREKELQKLVEQHEAAPDPHPEKPENIKQQKELAEKIETLRRSVKNMQAELRNQQQERQVLRRQLEQTRQSSAQDPQPKPAPEERPAETPLEYTALPKQVLVPRYSNPFTKSCEKLDPVIVAKALQQIAGFAAHDKAVWKQAARLSAIPHLYRIRVGINYRLILEWQTGQSITALDIVPREDLSNWIKKYK